MTEERVDDALEAFDALLEEEAAVRQATTQVETVNVEDEFDNLLATSTTDSDTPSISITATPRESNIDTTISDAVTSDVLSNTDTLGNNTETATNTTVEEELVVPFNTRTSILEDTTSRFQGASWFDTMKEQRVTIIGQGGIGSWTSLAIARLGIGQLILFDEDNVEEVNMAGQMFGRMDIGDHKVSAVYRHVVDLCGYINIRCNQYNYSTYNPLTPITIGALDNMDARKLIFNSWKNLYLNNPKALFIDGRLSADELQIFAMTGTEVEKMKIYETKWLFKQSDGEHTLCSFKQTTYMALMIASFIANRLVNHCANLANPDAMFDTPFYINYNSEMGYFKTSEI